MNQLTLTPTLVSRWAKSMLFLQASLTARMLLLLALVVLAVFPHESFAQTITFPKVDIDGVDDDSTGSEILVAFFKWAARIVIWGVMGWAGIICLKTIIASWQEQKSKEAGRWSALVADTFGSVVMVILVIAIGLWILSFIK